MKETLNLPASVLPLRFDTDKAEEEILSRWYKEKIFENALSQRKKSCLFVIPDAPPYSNSPLNFTTALNRILKDFIIRYRLQCGDNISFIPGWLVHGLPNEIRAIKNYRLDTSGTAAAEFRNFCKKSALDYISLQKEQIKRLGILGDWDHPYLTMDPDFEAEVIKTFALLVQNNQIYRGKKPVHWCLSCRTAIAESEVEYRDKTSKYVYVKFKLKDPQDLFPEYEKPVYLLVWSMSPWTLAGNSAVALHPDELYSLIEVDGEGYIIAEPLADEVAENCGFDEYTHIKSISGKTLNFKKVEHPLFNRESLIITGDFVRMDQGTGCMNITPGHGHKDFEIALKNHLPVETYADESGKLIDSTGRFAGLQIDDASNAIIEYLKENNLQTGTGELSISRPYCWRCSGPAILRATNQWFASIDYGQLRERTLEKIEEIEWLPGWGRERAANMLKSRPDWCISRQRTWGIPIPVFSCKDCKNNILDTRVIERVEKIIRKEGSDAWFTRKTEDLLPENFKCPACKSTNIEKSEDTFDIWFEAGVAAIAKNPSSNENFKPSDLAVEGTHQHRGWLQAALLLTTATKNRAPFLKALTHGWVLDEFGRSIDGKLAGSFTTDYVIDRWGSDILRLWAVYADYTRDIRISNAILDQVKKAYDRIRNTIRFILGNIAGFDPVKNLVEDSDLEPVDIWILHRKNKTIQRVYSNYSKCRFHSAYGKIHEFCLEDLSSCYFESIKDRLYADAEDSQSRRAAQTVLYKIAEDLIKAISPILCFLAEEAWTSLHINNGKAESVILQPAPKIEKDYLSNEEEEYWDFIISLRDEILSSIEKMRAKGEIKRSQDCSITLYLTSSIYDKIDEKAVKSILLVSEAKKEKSAPTIPYDAIRSAVYDEIAFKIEKSGLNPCKRCRFRYENINAEGLCPRCESALKERVG